MAKKQPPEQFCIRLDTLINLMHQQYVMGFVQGAVNDEDTDDNPIPMDKGGPRTAIWIRQQVDALRNMRKRPDGTYYMPEPRKMRAPT